MRVNPYRPYALPLLTDASLLKTLRQYRELEEALDGSTFPSVREMHALIRESIDDLEGELVRRSCEGYAAQGIEAELMSALQVAQLQRLGESTSTESAAP